MSGTWSPTRYRLSFKTVTQADNGTSGFDTVTTGHRLGDCHP
jgi:hypothetical protein